MCGEPIGKVEFHSGGWRGIPVIANTIKSKMEAFQKAEKEEIHRNTWNLMFGRV